MKQALRQGHLRDPEHLLPDEPGGQHPGEVHAAIERRRRRRRRRAHHGVRPRQRRVQRPGRHDAQRCGGGVQRGQDGGATRRATGSGCCSSLRRHSCGGEGDFIADTPQQRTGTGGCPTGPPRDSCSRVAGLDAVHNYMDYGADARYTVFTALQQARMASMWGEYMWGICGDVSRGEVGGWLG